MHSRESCRRRINVLGCQHRSEPGEVVTRSAIRLPAGGRASRTSRALLWSVDMHHDGGISLEEEARSDLLACSSRRRSDVAIALLQAQTS